MKPRRAANKLCTVRPASAGEYVNEDGWGWAGLGAQVCLYCIPVCMGNSGARVWITGPAAFSNNERGV